MKQTAILAHAQARAYAHKMIDEAPDGYIVTVQEPKRNLEQNALSWVIYTAFSDQLDWPVNGERVKMDQESWKDVLSAAFKRETTRVAKGIDGGVVMLGQRTSKFTKGEFAEYIEFLHATAAHIGVTIGIEAR